MTLKTAARPHLADTLPYQNQSPSSRPLTSRNNEDELMTVAKQLDTLSQVNRVNGGIHPGNGQFPTMTHVGSPRSTVMNANPSPPAQNQIRYVFRSGDQPLEGFTIKRAIGRGGFGEVYYAETSSGKEVALKLILRNLEIERRGVRECMNLKSPHLVAVHDLKSSDMGEHFVIMEYIRGPSLETELKRFPNGMSQDRVMFWLKGLVTGVDYLHDHGIVHRDLKPANLFEEEGYVKIGDYGLAKHMTENDGGGHSDSIGTCHYMAPEISKGRYDRSIDIYAIGVILYEMLAGHAPFQGATVGEILMKHLTERPDLSPIPEPFRRVVEKALVKDPARRPKKAGELLALVGDLPDQNQTPQWKPRPPRPQPDIVFEEDDVLRIGMDDDVLYIGPDARTPAPNLQRGRAPIQPAVFNNLTPALRAAPPKPAPVRKPAAAPKRVEKPKPKVQAPLVAPELPSGRIRVAELSSSMIWSAVICALLAAVTAMVNELDVAKRPGAAAFLLATPLMGAWLMLIARKLMEGRSIVQKRIKWLTSLAIGSGLGATTWLFASFTHASFAENRLVQPAFGLDWNSVVAGGLQPSLGLSVLYYATALSLMSLMNLTGRDRRRRLRLWPIAGAVLAGLASNLLWSFPQPWGVVSLAILATTSQLASPWSRDHALYARANRGWAA